MPYPNEATKLWRPIETAPKVHTPRISIYSDAGPTILVWFPLKGTTKVYWDNAWWYSCHEGRADVHEEPTHWMPDPFRPLP